jgi:hypothetical protein
MGFPTTYINDGIDTRELLDYLKQAGDNEATIEVADKK